MGYRMGNRAIYSILMLVCVVVFWFFENFYTPATYSKSSENGISSSFPEKLLPTSTTGEIVHHTYFSLSYNEPFEQAEWVAYELNKNQLTADDRKRPYFIEDPFVSTKSADWRNYKGSGYDRGHLVPAGDRRFSEQAYNETFYTSNISPQNRAFNTGIWNNLEKQTRRWTKRYGTLYVYTRGVLKKGLDQIGEEDVDVPDAFYKIIVRKTGNDFSGIAFVIPNKPQAFPLSNFVVSIDEVETITSIDFFYKLPINEQDSLEKTTMVSDWEF